MPAAPPSANALLDRITRLLDKAEATPYEAEAHALMAKASELAIRHMIATSDIEAARSGRGTQASVETRQWDERGVYRLQHAQLLTAVAAAHHAQVLRMPNRRADRITLVGFGEDLEIIQILYSSLRVQAASALSRWWNERRDHGELDPLTDSQRRHDRKSFLDGYALRVSQRLQAMQQDLHQELADETALVLADRSQQVADYVQQQYQVKRARSRRVHTGSFTAGGDAAADADLGTTRLPGPNATLPDGQP